MKTAVDYERWKKTFPFKLSTEVEKQMAESDAHHSFGFENSFPQCNYTPSSVKALNTHRIGF